MTYYTNIQFSSSHFRLFEIFVFLCGKGLDTCLFIEYFRLNVQSQWKIPPWKLYLHYEIFVVTVQRENNGTHLSINQSKICQRKWFFTVKFSAGFRINTLVTPFTIFIPIEFCVLFRNWTQSVRHRTCTTRFTTITIKLESSAIVANHVYDESHLRQICQTHIHPICSAIYGDSYTNQTYMCLAHIWF